MKGTYMKKVNKDERLKKKTSKHEAADRHNLIKKAEKAEQIIGQLESSWTEIADCYISDIQKLFSAKWKLSTAVLRCKERYVSNEYREGATHEKEYKDK